MTERADLSRLLFDHPFDGDEPIHEPLLATPGELIGSIDARDRVTDRARVMAEAGVGPRRGVAIITSSGVEQLVAMMAAWVNRAVAIPVNPRLPLTAVDEIIEETDPVAVWDEGRLRTRPSDRVFDDGVAFVLWTSGTTGRPKPILHTHAGYLELLDRVLGPLRSTRRDPERRPSPNLIPVPMALNAGIYNALFGLRAGASLVFLDEFTTGAFRMLVQRHQIRSTVLPPAAMAMLTDDDAITDLYPLRYVRSITAPLSPFQARRFTEKFGVTVLNGYGQAEIGEVIGWTAADAKTHPDKVGAVGRPHPGVDLRIDRPDELGIGELQVRPPSLAAGYASGDDLGDRLTDDGFVHTGDLARIDDDGFVWIEGRMGDLINRGGNKVFPDEVEEVLASVPGVHEAAVVPADDDRLGQVPVAFVVVDEGDDRPDPELNDAMISACRSTLAAYKVPVRFERTDRLPRNEAGKLLRRELHP